MRKRVMMAYDLTVLTCFGVYMAVTVWHLPEDLRHRLFAASMGMLAHLTGMSG